VEVKITYFEKKGRQNTAEVFELVRVRAGELGVKKVVVPTTGGDTGLLAIIELEAFQVVAVTHPAGYKEPGEIEVPEDKLRDLRERAYGVVTSTLAFGGVGRSVRRKFDTWQAEEIIAQTLKRFGEGVKVAVECTLMAADAGFVSPEEDIVACGGTGRGLDTALVIRPTNAQTFFEIKILELICKPREF